MRRLVSGYLGSVAAGNEAAHRRACWYLNGTVARNHVPWRHGTAQLSAPVVWQGASPCPHNGAVWHVQVCAWVVWCQGGTPKGASASRWCTCWCPCSVVACNYVPLRRGDAWHGCAQVGAPTAWWYASGCHTCAVVPRYVPLQSGGMPVGALVARRYTC